MEARSIVLAEPGSDCRWAAITEDQKRCEGIADWVMSGPHPTMKVCSTHLVATYGMGLGGAPINIPPNALSRTSIGAFQRLVDAVEAAEKSGGR